MQIDNGDLSLHAVVDGDDGAPPVLLLHGITSSWRTWDWLVPHLVGSYRVIRLDFRGHGGSGRAPGHYDMAGYVSDAAAAARWAGQPVIVIGHSLGGATAAGLAQTSPELVKAAVLEDPPIPSTPRTLEGNALLDGFRLMRESVPQMQAAGVTADVLAGILAQAPTPSGNGAFGELLHDDATMTMAGGLLELDATVLDGVLTGNLPEPVYDPNRGLGCPALLITADPSRPDCVAGERDTAQFAAVNPDAQVLVMTGAGHLVHDELASRDRFLEAVQSFLTTLP